MEEGSVRRRKRQKIGKGVVLMREVADAGAMYAAKAASLAHLQGFYKVKILDFCWRGSLVLIEISTCERVVHG